MYLTNERQVCLLLLIETIRTWNYYLKLLLLSKSAVNTSFLARVDPVKKYENMTQRLRIVNNQLQRNK